MTTSIEAHGRPQSFLRAVHSGRATLVLGSEPDLFIDGVSCGDQFTAHQLFHEGLICPEHSGAFGEMVPASLTDTGRTFLS